MPAGCQSLKELYAASFRPITRLDDIPGYRAWQVSRNARQVVVNGTVVQWFVPTVAGVAGADGYVGREILMPGCFQSSIANGMNIRALIDHDGFLEVGCTDDGSLRLVEDADGLHYTLTIPETRTGRILQAAIEQGRLRGISFKYRIGDSLGARRINGTSVVWGADLLEISFLLRNEPAYRTGTARVDVPLSVLRERLDAL